MIDYQTFTMTSSGSLQQYSYMNIDNQKYLYLSGQGQIVIGIHTDDISDISNWKFN
jgi:hypothetical protein